MTAAMLANFLIANEISVLSKQSLSKQRHVDPINYLLINPQLSQQQNQFRCQFGQELL